MAPETLGDRASRPVAVTRIPWRLTIDDMEEAQVCARRLLGIKLPARTAARLAAAFRVVRHGAGRPMTPGECLVEVFQRFVKACRVKQRDRHCQVPGCSRLAARAHPVIPITQGGSHDPWNLVGVCSAHRLCLLLGWVRVSGRAPDQLVWELGERRAANVDVDRPGAEPARPLTAGAAPPRPPPPLPPPSGRRRSAPRGAAPR